MKFTCPIAPLATLSILLLPVPSFADVPMGPYPDCGTGGACPADYDPYGDWYLGSGLAPEINPASIAEAERDLGSGNWVDRAWGTTVGRSDVAIAILDSGIEWDQGELRNKFRIHTGELPAAGAAPRPRPTIPSACPCPSGTSCSTATATAS